MPEPMTEKELNTLIEAGWARTDGREGLEKEFKFKGFRRAFGFMAAAAVKADALNHHPEWSNVYNRVQVLLITHDTGCLSALDFELAQAMDLIAVEIAAAPSAPPLAG